MPPKPRFIKDDEKLRHFAQVARVSLKDYPSVSQLKLFVGCEYLVFHYDSNGWPVFDDVYKCTGMTLNEAGLRTTLINKRTYDMVQVGCVPSRLGKHKILTHMPYRCTMEKTMKETGSSKHKRYIQGVTASLTFRLTNDPSSKAVNCSYVIPMNSARLYFSEEHFDHATRECETANQ